MSTFEIIELIVLGCVFLTIFTIYFCKAIKNKWLSQLMETLEEAMREAEEQFPHGHGDEKRQIVLEKLNEKCKELSIPYATMAALLTKIIAQIVSHWNILK